SFSRDWSSDVCSSDLEMTDHGFHRGDAGGIRAEVPGFGIALTVDQERLGQPQISGKRLEHVLPGPGGVRVAQHQLLAMLPGTEEIGRASCRERRRRWL